MFLVFFLSLLAWLIQIRQQKAYSKIDNRCQVTGCPSRTALHIHHIQAVSQGGPHAPRNLITLCEFHHALEPDPGHERVWGRIRTHFFTVVREHQRSNRGSLGQHTVRTHIRRLVLATQAEIDMLILRHDMRCSQCWGQPIALVSNQIELSCRQCAYSLALPLRLTEESGPEVAESLDCRAQLGVWAMRWEMLGRRTSLRSERRSNDASSGSANE